MHAALPARMAAPTHPFRGHARLLLCLLLLLSPWPLFAQAPVEGRDYRRIEDGQRWRPGAGTIEVVEIFAYGCGHCDQFQSALEAWKRRAGKDVRVHYLPAAFTSDDAYARGYFVLEAMDEVARVHPLVFDAIHRNGSLPPRGASTGEMTTFLAAQGLDAGRVGKLMTAPETDAKMAAAREFAVRSQLRGTPSLVVNGKYLVLGRTLDESLRIADGLVAMERAVSR